MPVLVCMISPSQSEPLDRYRYRHRLVSIILPQPSQRYVYMYYMASCSGPARGRGGVAARGIDRESGLPNA